MQFHSQVKPLKWEKDARQMYSVDIRTVMLASHPSVHNMRNSFELHGILNFRIYSIDNGIIKAGFQFSDIAVRRGVFEDKRAQELYSNLFFTDFAPDGRVLDFKFSNEIAPDDEQILSDIIKSFQLIVKDAFFSSWETDEENINGAFRAEYKEKDSAVTKQKLEYLTVKNIKGEELDDNISIKNSELKFEYNKNTSWIQKAEGNELLVFNSGDDSYLKVSSTVKLLAAAYNPDTNLAIWDDGKTIEQTVAVWQSLPKNQISIGEKSQKDTLKAKFGNRTLDQVADSLFEKYKSFNVQCIQELMQYLELHPESALDFPEYLREKKLNPTQQIMLVHALERNGSERSQTALSDIMLGSDFSRESRTQAAVAFGNIRKPSGEAISSLWEAYESGNRKDALDKNAGTISSTAVLALGSMAKNLGKSKNENFINKSESIKEKISADLEDKKDLNTTVALLHAAGNTADREMIGNISPYFDNKNPRIRAVAIYSLTNMDDSRVYDILTEKIYSETDINVRESIVNTMYRKEATEDTINAVIKNIPSEENDIVRGSMYRYLSKNRDFPGVKNALKEMLNNETSTEHRKIITKALRTKKPASTEDKYTN
ncbi:MAG: hypothetical protein JW864_16485 [Spirochaetes bacterium]|nr:hypothetical protein [Spirochaetota bacterium]